MKYHVHVGNDNEYQVEWKGLTAHGGTEREALLKLAEVIERMAEEFRDWASGLPS